MIVRGRVQAAGVLREAYRNEALFRWLLGDVRKDLKGKEKEESLLQWLVDWVGQHAVSLRLSPGFANFFLCLCLNVASGGLAGRVPPGTHSTVCCPMAGYHYISCACAHTHTAETQPLLEVQPLLSDPAPCYAAERGWRWR